MSSSPPSPQPAERRLKKQRLDEATQRLVKEAEVLALKRAGLARLVVACLLILVIAVMTDGLTISNQTALAQIAAAKITLTLFGTAGWMEAWLASRRIGVRELPTISALIDAVLILGNIGFNHWSLGVPGGFFASFPVIWVVPITMAATAIYYQPWLQTLVAAIYTGGFAFLAFTDEYMTAGERRVELVSLSGQFSAQANFVRVVMIFGASLILILVARQGRLLLERAVRETTMRLNLTRYLPSELAPILTQQAFSSLRAGRRIRVTLLFVDMRASTTFGETMDPARLAVFISAFRRRVMRASAAHGGVIDKFTGDGALILFGVPTESENDASRAIACGEVLLELISRWNKKRGFDPAVRIGIGIHTGEVFCGVVGDEARLEFTVLGETVNTGARIEQATKQTGFPLLVSQETLDAAGNPEGWVEVEDVVLPGITRPVCILRPADAPNI